jgi:hypothetical protein
MKAKSRLSRKLRMWRYAKCTKCGVQLRGKKLHKCRVRYCDYCRLAWERHHARMCPYWGKRAAIKAEAKKKRLRSHYARLEQVGFLGEEAVTPDADLTCCPDRQRVLGDSEEAFIAVKNGPTISFVLAPPGYTGTMTIDESKTWLREVPSDFHAVILAAQAPVKQASTFLLTLTIADPSTVKTGALAQCTFRAQLPEHLPLYQIGDVLRVHRGLLTERSEDGKRLAMSASGGAAAWVVFGENGSVRSESGSAHSMTAFEQTILGKYTQFAESVKQARRDQARQQIREKTPKRAPVPEDYVEIAKGVYVPAHDERRINESDLTSISSVLPEYGPTGCLPFLKLS